MASDHASPSPPPTDWWSGPAVRAWSYAVAGLVLLAFGSVFAITLIKSGEREQKIVTLELVGSEAITDTVPSSSKAPLGPPRPFLPKAIQPQPSVEVPSPEVPASPSVPQPMPPVLQPSPHVVAPKAEPLAIAPLPRPKVSRPPSVAVSYDRFGNPAAPTAGLGGPGAFKGKKLLFWSGYENAGRVFFGPTNPLWKAWEQQGFTVRVEFGRFRPEWLRDIDQLWVLSTAQYYSPVPAGVPPELVVNAVDLLPASEIPSGFSRDEYKFIVRATLDMALSRVHPFDEAAFREVEKFARSGKGLCLLADDEPYLYEANELARRLYGVSVKGNYIADQVAYVKGHGLTPADIRKFGGRYEAADHPLLTGVNFLYEGITISNVGMSDKLDVALQASDGQPLIALSKEPGQRVVIDCAFTQFCHGPTERTSYILKSAGAVRLAQNIAAYLAGK